jgi:RHS repeat-associated protein
MGVSVLPRLITQLFVVFSSVAAAKTTALRVSTLLGLLAGVGFALGGSVSAQSAQVTLTPGSGNYPTGWQIAVHAEFCITDPEEHFLNNGTITLNGNQIATGQASSPEDPCIDARVADAIVTVADGNNSVAASIQTYVGENVDVVYTWTQTRNHTAPANAPYVDISVHNGQNRNVAMCAMACFNTVISHTTPAYWTLDTPRSATLFYSTGQLESRHTVDFIAANQASVEPDQITAKLRRTDGSFVTLTTGGTTASFVPPSSGLHRYAIQFEDSTLATGAYNYTLVIGATWSGWVRETSVPIRLLVINERTSPYGAGWSVAGVGRVIVTPADSVVMYDGAGTIQFWGAPTSCVPWTCTYTGPPGEFDQLKRVTNSGNPVEHWFYRTTVDGTKLTFYSFGTIRLISIQDVWGNGMGIRWRPNDPQRIDSIIDPVGKAIVFGYDGSNRLATIRDVPGNRTTSITVNSENNLTQIQDPVGGKPFQQATYDPFHRLRSRVNRRGDRWAMGYDIAGRLAVDSSPPITADTTSTVANTAAYLPLVTRYRSPQAAGLSAVDSGGIGSLTPAVGSVRKIRVDRFGALLEVLEPLSEYVLYQRNQHGQITESYDSAGHHYLTWSGPRLTSDYNMTTSKVVNFEWNTATNRVTRRYGTGTVETKYFYDATGYRLDSTKVKNEPATRFAYDARGRVVTVTDPRGHITRTFYDGNAWSNTDSVKTGSRRAWFRYDVVAGRPSTVVSPGGHIDSTFYDTLNRVTRVGGPLGASTSYTYGDSINLTAITDALGHTTSVQKNAIGWDTLSVDQFSETQRFEYDRSGRVKRLTNRRSQLTRFVYDNIGRMTSRILADGRITNFSFGSTTSVVWNDEGADTLRWKGDTLWEVAVRNTTAYTVRTLNDTAAKDFVVRLSPAPLPPNNWLEVRYDLDSAGRVQRILPHLADPDTLSNTTDGLVTRYGWHGAFNLSLQTRANHELARAIYAPAALNSTFGADYVQDTLGRTIQQVKGGGGEFENYTYDVRGRLTAFARYAASPPCAPGDTLSEFGSVCTTGTTLLNSDNFSYDAAGNRTDKNALVDAANRLRRFNGDTMLYDLDGNLIRRYRLTDSVIFNQRLYWNSIGQIDSIRTTRSASTQTTSFGYDGFGRRVRKTVGASTSYYVFSSGRVIGEYTGGGVLTKAYAYQPGVDHPHAVYQASAWHYYATDGRGNVRGLLNSAGTGVEAEYKYTPYGDTVSTSGSLANAIRFSGREYDGETGLYYVRARYYDPTSGRFVSEDAGALIDYNRYVYAGNDPVNKRDPSGRSCEWVETPKQEAPPVARSATASGSGSSWELVCDDGGGAGAGTGGGGGWDWFYGGSWWGSSDFFYDPLFLNGGLPFVDFTPINIGGFYDCANLNADRCARVQAVIEQLPKSQYRACREVAPVLDGLFVNGKISWNPGLGWPGETFYDPLRIELGTDALDPARVGLLGNVLSHEGYHALHKGKVPENHARAVGNTCGKEMNL